MGIFPETYAVGAQFGVVLVPSPDGMTSDAHVASTQGSRGRGRDFPQRHWIFRRAPSGRSALQPRSAGGCGAPRLHHQRHAARSVTGEVLDFVGGRKDLEAGIIRTIGDPEQRFAEDKLRMLRAVRFAARFEYAIEPATFAAIQKLADADPGGVAGAGARRTDPHVDRRAMRGGRFCCWMRAACSSRCCRRFRR